MAADDRKKRILEHLAKSSGGNQFIPAQKAAKPQSAAISEPPPPPPTPEPSPPPTPQPIARQRQVLSHLNLSSGNFGDFSLEDKGKKQKILAHVRKTQT